MKTTRPYFLRFFGALSFLMLAMPSMGQQPRLVEAKVKPDSPRKACSVRWIGNSFPGARKRGQQLCDVRRFSQTAYAVYDPKTGRWSKWQVLELPGDDQFNMARNACAQWLVLPDGTLLVPIYFAKAANVPASVTERGAMLGNFGASAIDARQYWVTVAEYVAKGRASPRGANGSVFAARVLWSKPNSLTPGKTGLRP